MALSRTEKDRRIKRKITEWIDIPDTILEDSDETYVYDSMGSWWIGTLATQPNEGQPLAEAVLNRPLRAGQPLASSHLYQPGAISPAAFEDAQGDSICRQLAFQMGFHVEEIHEDMDALQRVVHPLGSSDPFEGEN